MNGDDGNDDDDVVDQLVEEARAAVTMLTMGEIRR